MKIFKNRVVLGLISILLAMVICFIVAPFFNSAKEKMTNAVRLKTDISAGNQIEEKDVEIVEIGIHNMKDFLSEKGDVVGKFALLDMVKNEIVLNSKIADNPAEENNYLYNLDGSREAMSISIMGFANGLSGKLQSGDIVSIYAPKIGSSDEQAELHPRELKYIKVISATNQNGSDVNKTEQFEYEADGKENKLLPSAVTLLVTEKQAEILAQLEVDSRPHIALVFRGNSETAQKFLDLQDEILEEIGENSASIIDKNTITTPKPVEFKR